MNFSAGWRTIPVLFELDLSLLLVFLAVFATQFFPLLSLNLIRNRTTLRSVVRHLYWQVMEFCLEQELDADLRASGVVVLVGRSDRSEGRGSRINSRGREIRFVERITELQPELKSHSFVDLRVL